MREIPILFNSEMVNALLDGRKTQTRRIVKPQPEMDIKAIQKVITLDGKNRDGFFCAGDDYGKAFFCPYGQPGDLIWVREGFTLDHLDHNFPHYRADMINPSDPPPKPHKWKPSIHMPKAIARIWLQVKKIELERLQQITDQDVIDEGIAAFKCVPGDGYPSPLYKHYMSTSQRETWIPDPLISFQSLWQSIHGPDAWDANPWVWVVHFDVISTTGKPKSWQGKQLRVDEQATELSNQQTHTS